MTDTGDISGDHAREELPGVSVTSGGMPRGGAVGRSHSWAPAELASAALMAAVAVLAISGLAAGIAGASGMGTGPASTDLGDVLDQSTDWAAPWVPLLLLVALGLMWWQIRRRRPRSDPLDPGEDSGTWSEKPSAHAPRHVIRVRRLACSTGILLVVTVVASVINLVDSIGSLPHGAPGWQVWETSLVSVGTMLATLVLCAFGFLATVGLLRRYRTDL